jgi:hypothetical protein
MMATRLTPEVLALKAEGFYQSGHQDGVDA